MKIWIPECREGFEHWKALRSVRDSLAAKYDLPIATGVAVPAGDEPLLIVGHHLLTEAEYDVELIPEGSVLVNTEYEITPVLSRKFKWIDIWPENNGRWGDFEPMVPYALEDGGEVAECDVLFTGCINERRLKILKELALAGLHVEAPSGYENEKYRRGAKVILDCHYVPFAGRMNVTRVLPGMMHGKVVVSESEGGFYGDALKDGYLHVGYEGLVDACKVCVKERVELNIPSALQNLKEKAGAIRCL